MNTFSNLVDLWPTPSLTLFAVDVGVPVQTASSWKRRGSIPSRQWLAVVRAAEARGIEGVTVEALARMADGRSQQERGAPLVTPTPIEDVGASSPLEFVLPVAPSTNALYQTAPGGRVRYKTPLYSRWIATCSALLIGRRAVTPEAGPYMFEIGANISRRRDLDNVAKATLDLFVRLGVAPDDRWCDALVIRRDSTLERDTMRIRILSLEDSYAA
jgi:Holliday junction resolvase RusA-like endonuclease